MGWGRAPEQYVMLTNDGSRRQPSVRKGIAQRNVNCGRGRCRPAMIVRVTLRSSVGGVEECGSPHKLRLAAVEQIIVKISLKNV
jgi:hypothetical protein